MSTTTMTVIPPAAYADLVDRAAIVCRILRDTLDLFREVDPSLGFRLCELLARLDAAGANLSSALCECEAVAGEDVYDEPLDLAALDTDGGAA